MRRTFLVVVAVVLAASPAFSGPAEETAQSPRADVLALVAEARMRLEQSEIAEGLQLFRQAVTADPKNQELAEEFGLALAEVGMGDQAIEQLQKVDELSPEGHATLGMLLAQGADDRAQLERAVIHLRQGLDATPQGPQARLILVQSLLRMEQGEQAWQALQPLLAERPDDPRLILLAGQAKRLDGKTDEAITYLRQAATAPEMAQRATIELVETLAAAGRNREAADTLGAFLEKEGATLTGLSRWATLLARAGDRAKARSVLDGVLAKDPKFREALLLKALLEARDGHTDASVDLYHRALALEADDADAALGLARVLIDARRLEEARAVLDDMWKRSGRAKEPNRELQLEVAQERATAELIDQAADAAKPWLDRLSPPPLERRGLALWGEYFRIKEAYAAGLAWATKAQIADDPDTRRLRDSMVGEFRLATGDEAGGKAALQALLAGSEQDCLAALGVLERRKRYAELVKNARESLARFPNSEDVAFILAAGLERVGKWDEAVDGFRALIKKSPENAGALNYLGYMFADRGVRLEEARELIKKAVEIDPTSGAFMDSLGWVHFRLGDIDVAANYLEEAARLEPRDATVHEHLGELYLKRGQTEKAVEAFRLALALKPEEEGQKERIEARLAAIAGAAKR